MAARAAIAVLVLATLTAVPAPAHAASRILLPHLSNWPFRPPITPTPPAGCAPSAGAVGALSIDGRPSDRPAEHHADLNLALRGFTAAPDAPGLVDYGGGTDRHAPKLSGLLGGAPVIGRASFRVNDWVWASNARGGPIAAWPVTLLVVGTVPGQTIHVPPSGYDIGSGYGALVLYAAPGRATLKYTRDDNVVRGYTVHVEGVCVDPVLLEHYRAADAAGRRRLPALKGGQALGRAMGDGVGVAIRDAGSFMDPRSRKDWW